MSTVYGLHAVGGVLETAPERIRVLYVQRGGEDKRRRLAELAKAAGVRVEIVDARRLDRRADGPHQGVLAECHDLELSSEAELEAAWKNLESPRLLLALDGVQDPRNLGACLRTAGAAGVQAVLLPKRKTAPLSAAALKAAAGVAERLFIVEVSNLARRLEWLKAQGAWVIGAAGDAPDTVYQADFTADTVLVLGGEGAGLRRLSRDTCDRLVRIPMADDVESLNVSVAAGILLFEAIRQRENPGGP
jgi:23S rRNA (guanosine2251-2'-O)-methyltransferase